MKQLEIIEKSKLPILTEEKEVSRTEVNNVYLNNNRIPDMDISSLWSDKGDQLLQNYCLNISKKNFHPSKNLTCTIKYPNIVGQYALIDCRVVPLLFQYKRWEQLSIKCSQIQPNIYWGEKPYWRYEKSMIT